MYSKAFALCAAACSLAVGGAANSNEADRIAAAFGARPTVLDISVSPDGTKVAVVQPLRKSEEVVWVYDLGENVERKLALSLAGEEEIIAGCDWGTDTRLICTIRLSRIIDGVRAGFTRVVALDADGGNIKMLSNTGTSRTLVPIQYGGAVLTRSIPGKPGKVLMTRQTRPTFSTGTNIYSLEDGLAVDEVDIGSLSTRQVERPRSDTASYIADDTGTVRIMSVRKSDFAGYTTPTVSYQFRKSGSRNWEDLSTRRIGATVSSGFYPIAVDAAKNVVYGLDDNNGFDALFSISLDSAMERKLVVARDDADVDGLIRLGPTRRVVGATYATERRSIVFFDAALKSIAEALSAALPNQPQIEFLDESEDGNWLLISASSDTDPGMTYLLDRKAMQLEPLFSIRPELNGMLMGAMKPVTFPAGDGTRIPGYLTLPPGSDGKGLPAIVMPHGGPSSRDEWGFDWLVQYFVQKGYAVLQPNFRGSSGYGSAWFMQNGFQSWRIAVGDVNDAGRWLVDQGIAAPGKLAIVGWSYGGYAALQSAVLDPELYKAIVAIAPVTDLGMLRNEFSPFVNYRLARDFIGEGPHIAEGSPAKNAGRITAPVLLFHGSIDENVGVRQSRIMADALRSAGKRVDLVEFDKLDHYLDDTEVRTLMLSRSASFLDSALGR